MVAELRYLLGFSRSPSETVARGRTQTPSRENTFFGFLGNLLGLPFRAQAFVSVRTFCSGFVW